jgi:glycosyltransferase involved in cell wall biosynthesis
MTLISAAGAQRADVPNVSTIVTDPEIGFAPVAGRFQWFKKRILHRLYNRSAQVLAVSDGARESAKRFYGIRDEKIVTHRNGVDVELIRQQSDAKIDDLWWTSEARNNGSSVFRIVSAGRLNHEKGFHLLVASVNELRHRFASHEFRLAIAGEGGHRSKLQQQIEQLGLAENIRLPGFQNNAAAWYRSADVFVLPSLMEGMPNVLLEAMVVGTPVVSSNCHSGPAEILDKGRFGELVSVGSSAALTEGIASIVEHPADAAMRAQSAMRSVETVWSIQAATRRLEEILEAAVRCHRQHR